MVPAAEGSGLTVIGNMVEVIPVPHAFVALTVRLPEVAVAEKLPVMDGVVPDGVKPVPE
jgi:hypothetical protein